MATTVPANYYVISVAPGTYTNDTATVSRPMTIEAAQPGSTVILNETVALPNQKGILISLAELTVDGLTFQGANIPPSLGVNGAGIRAEAGSQAYTLTVRNSRFILKPNRNSDGRQLPARRRADQQRLYE